MYIVQYCVEMHLNAKKKKHTKPGIPQGLYII